MEPQPQYPKLKRDGADMGRQRTSCATPPVRLPAMQPAIAFRGATYSIAGREVLRGLDLDILPGETVVLLGRSGSGKTTALKLVNALLVPTAGEVLVEGKETRAWDPI